MLTAIHTRAEVKSRSVIEVQAPGVPAGTTVEVIILFAQARHEGSMPRVLSDRAQAIERAKGLLRVRDQAPDDDAVVFDRALQVDLVYAPQPKFESAQPKLCPFSGCP